MRALLVDDEPLALRRLEIKLHRIGGVEVAGTCADGRAALASIAQLRPDLVFLDVRMPGLDGFQIADAVAAAGGPAVVFVTAFDHYANRAFDAQAVDYLVKPVEDARLRAAVDRAKAHLGARTAEQRVEELESILAALRAEQSRNAPPPRDLWVNDRDGVTRIAQRDIDWVEAERDYVRIHVGDRSWLVRETMANMEARLDKEMFQRVHRSAIVNVARVRGARTERPGRRMLVLTTGASIRVGRSYAQSALERLTGSRGCGG